MQATQHCRGLDYSRLCGLPFTVSSGDPLSNALMRPRTIVVIDKLRHHAAQLVSMEDEHMVKAFAFQASDATLADSVRFRRVKWRLQLLDTGALSDGSELLTILAVIVVDEVFGRFTPGSSFPELLRHPGVGGRGGHRSVYNAARL